jgi:Tfp pilus assembly protein PilN
VAIKVNLLPREAAVARRARPGPAIAMPKLAVGAGLVAQVMTVILMLVVVGLAVMWYMASSSRGSYAREITQLKAQNEALKSQLVELRQAEAAKADIQRRIEIMARVAKSQGVPLATLTGILKSVPTGIWLSTLEMKPREEKVRAEPARPAAGSDILGKLEAKKTELGATPAPPPAAAPAREVTQLVGYAILIKGRAFSNLQIADFMENLRKAGVFSDVDFVVTQAERVEQTRVMAFEVTANVKL